MTTQRKSISRFTLILGGLLVGLPATRAFAAEPTTASEAQAMAQRSRDRADHYRALGGTGYKTGLVQRAEADTAKFAALAERLAAPPVATEVRSPEAEHYARLAAQYRATGGTGYKTGLIQWAEAQERKFELTPAATPATDPARLACQPIKPVAVLACNP